MILMWENMNNSLTGNVWVKKCVDAFPLKALTIIGTGKGFYKYSFHACALYVLGEEVGKVNCVCPSHAEQ